MVSSSWVATDRNRVIGELTRGREIADELRAILREAAGDHSSTDSSSAAAQGLLGKILDSFTHSLLLLGTGYDQVSQSQVVPAPSRKSEDSKDRRGCYKRRRSSDTWTKETPTFFDDGYAWRKYGQKLILHAIHPRNYFRCTHKHDQGCKATKQVQKVEDDLFRTTYHGHHTCTTTTNSLVLQSANNDIIPTPDDYSNNATCCILSFDRSHQRPQLINNSAAIKQEKQYQIDQNIAFSSVTDQGPDVISSDVYSCTTSTHDADLMVDVDSVFDHFLQF